MNKNSLTSMQAIIGVVIGLLIVAGIALLFNLLPWLAWNLVLVPLFGVPAVGFWQMLVVTWFIRFITNGIIQIKHESKS